jgi:hypothetical protein
VGSLTPIFWQNTLPLMVTIMVTVLAATLAGLASNKNLAQRIDDLRSDMNRRFEGVDRQFGEVNRRLDRIEQKLEGHDSRLTTLEERTSPLRR